MVVTRSAERRLAATGKVEELAVRPKFNDSPSTPTPSQTRSKRSNNAVAEVPSAAPKSLLVEPQVAGNSPGTGEDQDDETSFLTANESPDSYRDAHSLLLEGDGNSTPASRPVQPLQGLEDVPADQPSAISQKASIAATRRGQSEDQDPLSDHTRSGLAENNASKLTAAAASNFNTTEADDVSDDAPEVLTSKGSLHGRGSSTPRNKRSTKSALDRQHIIQPVNQAIIKNTQPKSSGKHTPVTDVPGSPVSATMSAPVEMLDISSDTIQDEMETRSSQSTMTVRARTGILDTGSLQHTSNSKISNIVYKPYQHRSGPNHQPKMTSSLENFRQNVLQARAARIEKKRNRRFSLTRDWSTKRQKFVIT